MNSINTAIVGLKNIFGQAKNFVSNMTHEDYVKLSDDNIRLTRDLEAEKRAYKCLAEKVLRDEEYQCSLLIKIQRAKEALG